jgi:hypothetical protein
MSFALNPAPFSEIDDYERPKQDKRRERERDNIKNRTIKNKSNTNTIETMIQNLHNSTDEGNDKLSDFNPLPIPQSVGVQKVDIKNQLSNRNINNENQTNVNPSNSNSNSNIKENVQNMQNYNDFYKKFQNKIDANNINSNNIEAFSKNANARYSEYYKQNIPTYYNQMSETTYGNKELLDKLNYMIHLLEEQQDEKTGNVTEEIILYTFLGVFMIFIIDSFARVGKYVR